MKKDYLLLEDGSTICTCGDSLEGGLAEWEECLVSGGSVRFQDVIVFSCHECGISFADKESLEQCRIISYESRSWT